MLTVCYFYYINKCKDTLLVTIHLLKGDSNTSYNDTEIKIFNEYFFKSTKQNRLIQKMYVVCMLKKKEHQRQNL